MRITSQTIAKALTQEQDELAVTKETKAWAIVEGTMHGSKVSLELETHSDDKISLRYNGHFAVSVSTELRMEVIVSVIKSLLPQQN